MCHAICPGMHPMTTLKNASTAALESKHMISQVIGVMHHLTGMTGFIVMMDQGVGKTEHKTGMVGQVIGIICQIIGMIASLTVGIKMHLVTVIKAPNVCMVSKLATAAKAHHQKGM